MAHLNYFIYKMLQKLLYTWTCIKYLYVQVCTYYIEFLIYIPNQINWRTDIDRMIEML